MSDSFTRDELETLREHGIVIFAERVIYEAQPPLAEARIAEIQALCSGPLPPGLLELWRLTAGGRMDYDLSLSIDGSEEAISWCELFFDGSRRYNDLQGWIEHEQDITEEAAETHGGQWSGKLDYLPFGGFEYCDRIYVEINPGPDYGQVIAWKKGLPGWAHGMQQDGMATLAPNVHAAFAALMLDEDPLQSVGSYYAGINLLEYLDERIAQHGLERALVEQLIAFYRRAFVDWRPLLESGAWADAPRAMNRAIRYAISTDDAALIGQLAAAGVRFDQALRGSSRPIDDALISHAFAVVDALMTAGVTVPAGALQQINRAIPAPLVSRLLQHGAQADALAIARCVACGSTESARLIAKACNDDVSADYAAASQAMRERYEADLCKVQAGKLGHYLGADGLAERIDHLRRFVL